ncbi:MAG: hypothetical protein PHW63_01195 [Alphaproteobacteria bacterium]|nr:hypothetical protein [Alphaproteobacteria bacterium]
MTSVSSSPLEHVWQTRAQRELNGEDYRQIRENVTGFFNVLRDWQRTERAKQSQQNKEKEIEM